LADFVARRGAKVDDKARPDIDTAEAHELYIKLLRAATSPRQTDADFARNRKHAESLSPDDESYLARMTRANVLSHRGWLAANQERHRMRLKWAAFFDDFDLLLCPPAASAAFPHDQEGERHERTITVDGEPVPTTDQLFWAGFSGLVYLPSTVAPIGFTAEGLPLGAQIVGPQYGDRLCIHLARLIEREYQGFVPPPDFP
jgi:amidase